MFPQQSPDAVIEDWALEVAMGDVPGTSVIHKFGNAPDFDSTDGEIDLWSGANDAAPNLMQYTYSTTADIDSLSSSDNTDTQNIEVQGLDANFVLVTQTVALTGQTRVALTTALVRVFRLKNVGATSLAGTCYCFVNVATTAGVPDTLANIRAMIAIGDNQTMMVLFTVPARTNGYMLNFHWSLDAVLKTAVYQCRLYARPSGGVFQVKHEISISDNAPTYTRVYSVPEKFPEKTDLALRVSITTAAVTAARVSGGFEIVLVRD